MIRRPARPPDGMTRLEPGTVNREFAALRRMFRRGRRVRLVTRVPTRWLVVSCYRPCSLRRLPSTCAGRSRTWPSGIAAICACLSDGETGLDQTAPQHGGGVDRRRVDRRRLSGGFAARADADCEAIRFGTRVCRGEDSADTAKRGRAAGLIARVLSLRIDCSSFDSRSLTFDCPDF